MAGGGGGRGRERPAGGRSHRHPDGGAWLQAVQLSAGITFSIDAVTDDQTLPGATVGTPRYATPIPSEGSAQGGDR